MPITYNSVSLPDHRIYNTPYFQRLFSVDIPDIDEEIESRTTQHITLGDVLRVPSSDAVYRYIETTVGNTIGLTVIPTIQPHVYDKSPSSDAIYSEFLKVPKVYTPNIFQADNTFEKLFTNVNFDLADSAVTTQVPNAHSIREFVYDAVDSNTEKYVFANYGIEWVVNHGRNTDTFIERVRDENNKTIFADTYVEDLDTVRFTFTTPTKGYVILQF